MMLYAGTPVPVPLRATPALRVEPVETARQVVCQWFASESICFIGAHTGCSCGFPSVAGDAPVRWFDGLSLDSPTRADDLASVRALLALLAELTAGGSPVELLPVWDGREALAPLGVVEWTLEELDADRFFFTEQFLHRVRAR
ncbi:MAG: hypothetical protein R2712_14645 [Vicinamibacterales bacterium]